ncbi:MAG: hypothetical protein ACREON_11425 [Gemmatimonadaceae bacterium]
MRGHSLRYGTFLLLAATAGVTSSARAQALHYPAFQHPHIVQREFNIGVAGGDGTALVGDWREGLGPSSSFLLHVGLFDPEGGADTRFMFGGGFQYQLTRSTQEMPLDLMLTAGGYVSFGDDLTIVRLPFGVSAGHRFTGQGQVAFTPFVHPRISLDFCGDCGDDTDVGIAFDLGLDVELTRAISLRGAVTLGGGGYFEDADSSFGVAVAIRPRAAAR